MTTLTTEIINTPAIERFVSTANYKHGWTTLLIEEYPEALLKANAELIDVKPYKYPPYTAKAIFRVDRLTNVHGLPLGEKLTGKRLISRGLLIKQVQASELVSAFGLNGRIYLGLQSNPRDTRNLVARLNELFNIGVMPEDIVSQEIPDEASCIIVKFHSKSVGFTGSFQVDLYTPLVVLPTDQGGS